MSKQLSITAEMNYLKKVTGQDEPTILAQAVKKGIDELYKEQIVSFYLKGRVSRKKVVEIIGAERLKISIIRKRQSRQILSGHGR